MGTLDVPMRLFGLETEVEDIDEVTVQQIDDSATNAFPQIILSLVQNRFHGCKIAIQPVSVQIKISKVENGIAGQVNRAYRPRRDFESREHHYDLAFIRIG